jgi:phosphoribosyl 1,2-cyclic phosphate phosphodiesterase
MTDASAIENDASAIEKEVLRNLPRPEILIIGGLRAMPHATHFSFDQALTIAMELRCRKAFLTHICHRHSHREIEEYCRNFAQNQGIVDIEMGPAWDGQELTINH